MGIIEKQTIKGTAYSYIGVGLGFINTGLLLPNILSAAENGLLGLLNSYAIIFALIASLGFNSTIIRMFTFFRDEKKQHNGFVFILILVGILGIIVSSALYFGLKPIIYDSNIEQSPLFIEYFFYTIPFLIAYLLFNYLDNYFTVLYNATIGLFLNEFIKRIFFSIAIALFYFDVVDLKGFVSLYIAAFFVPPTAMLFLLIKSKQFSFKPNFKFLNKSLIKSMASVSLFSFISSFAGIVVMRVDIIMLSAMASLSTTGIYTISYFFGALVKVPSKPLLKIASALYADAWKNNDLNFIQDIYKKSVINQTIIGILLFIGIWANLPNVFQLLPEEYSEGKYVILFIALASVIEMTAGGNNVIISTSKDYKVLTYFTIILMIIAIGANYIFIPLYGLSGAAFASFLSTLIYVLLRYFFLLIKYKLQPFNFKIIIVIIIAAFTYSISLFLPPMPHFIIDIVVRSILISIIFGFLIIASKVSNELNDKFWEYSKLVMTKFKL